MNQENNVFMTPSIFNHKKAFDVIQEKLDPKWIKTKSQGGTNLSYIGGNVVIRLLNKAFNYQWSFEIVKEEVVKSIPKPVFEGWGKQRRPVLNPDGSQKMEPQPPVAKVLGRLTVPGLGIREQYGAQIMVGGATEQESAFKAASTDALKKCASLFGIGLELYGDDDENLLLEYLEPEMGTLEKEEPKQAQKVDVQISKASATPDSKQVEVGAKAVSPQKPAIAPAPTPKAEAAPAPVNSAPAQTAPTPTMPASSSLTSWEKEDIERLRELKKQLGITKNEGLNPYMEEMVGFEGVTYTYITPTTVKDVIKFLQSKVS